MSLIPDNISKLALKRQQLRADRKFAEADAVRAEIEALGFKVVDAVDGVQIESLHSETHSKASKKREYLEIALFGSGEISPTGRKVHEYLVRDFSPPVSIALLETPAGFEVNPLNWYKKVEEMMNVGLQNFQPNITIVEALRNEGEKSTNNPEIVNALTEAQYIHTGAGSPTYTVRHLRNSLALKKLLEAAQKNTPLSFASAAAIACSKYSLPVYEIYKAGEDPHWIEGLDFFSQWNLNLTIVPHFNNAEGGKDIDTSKCYMGEKRFSELLTQLPKETTVLGIDEQTACIFNMQEEKVTVMGNNTAVIIKNKESKIIKAGEFFSFAELR